MQTIILILYRNSQTTLDNTLLVWNLTSNLDKANENLPDTNPASFSGYLKTNEPSETFNSLSPKHSQQRSLISGTSHTTLRRTHHRVQIS